MTELVKNGQKCPITQIWDFCEDKYFDAALLLVEYTLTCLLPSSGRKNFSHQLNLVSVTAKIEQANKNIQLYTLRYVNLSFYNRIFSFKSVNGFTVYILIVKRKIIFFYQIILKCLIIVTVHYWPARTCVGYCTVQYWPVRTCASFGYWTFMSRADMASVIS